MVPMRTSPPERFKVSTTGMLHRCACMSARSARPVSPTEAATYNKRCVQCRPQPGGTWTDQSARSERPAPVEHVPEAVHQWTAEQDTALRAFCEAPGPDTWAAVDGIPQMTRRAAELGLVLP